MNPQKFQTAQNHLNTDLNLLLLAGKPQSFVSLQRLLKIVKTRIDFSSGFSFSIFKVFLYLLPAFLLCGVPRVNKQKLNERRVEK
jgi:hypothetical protein